LIEGSEATVKEKLEATDKLLKAKTFNPVRYKPSKKSPPVLGTR
jgi:hypothetical protein